MTAPSAWPPWPPIDRAARLALDLARAACRLGCQICRAGAHLLR